jgi:dihydrofolate reductase
MRKIILYIASSINGFIAKSDGDVDWLEQIPNPNNNDYGFSDLNKSIDTTIQGHSSYQQIVSWGIEFPYKNTTNYVITTNKELKDNENVNFISENHIEFIRDLKEMDGKDIWLIGGGKVNSLLLENYLIDEIHLFIMPILLEDGIKLFEYIDAYKTFKIIDTESYDSGVVKYKLGIK